MQRSDGMNYAPQGKPKPVVGANEFVFAATALEHGHIFGMCNGLIEAGGTLKWVYDEDPKKVEAFVKRYPNVQIAKSEQEILQDSNLHLIAAAADRIGKKKVIVVAVFGLAISLWLFVLSDQFWISAFVFMLTGVFGCTIESMLSALITQIRSGNGKQSIMISQIFFGLGAMGGVAGSGLIAEC